MLIENGYAIAAIHVADMAPDDKVNYVNGVLQLYPEQLTADNGMKAIGAGNRHLWWNPAQKNSLRQ